MRHVATVWLILEGSFGKISHPLATFSAETPAETGKLAEAERRRAQVGLGALMAERLLVQADPRAPKIEQVGASVGDVLKSLGVVKYHVGVGLAEAKSSDLVLAS